MKHGTQQVTDAQVVVNSALAWAKAQGIKPQPDMLALLQQYAQDKISWLEVHKAFIARNVVSLSHAKSKST